MLKALSSTITELADSKKAAYSFAATLVMAVLIVAFKVDRETAAFIVAPLVAGAVAQAHVDAAAAKGPQAPSATVISNEVVKS